MRRSITTLLALALTLAGAEALEAQQGSTRIGLKGGINFADFEFEDAEDAGTQSRKGFIGGVFMNFGSSDFITWQPEVLFSRVGTEFEDELADFEVQLDYVQVPVMARFNFAPGSTVRPHLLLGPYVAFNVGCKFEAEVDGDEGSTDCEDGAGEDVAESIDWGGVFGGGLSFVGARGTLTVDGRYNLGLADVFDFDTGDETDVKNRFWNVLVGFSVPFGGM